MKTFVQHLQAILRKSLQQNSNPRTLGSACFHEPCYHEAAHVLEVRALGRGGVGAGVHAPQVRDASPGLTLPTTPRERSSSQPSLSFWETQAFRHLTP